MAAGTGVAYHPSLISWMSTGRTGPASGFRLSENRSIVHAARFKHPLRDPVDGQAGGGLNDTIRPRVAAQRAPHRRAQIDTNDTPHTVNALPAPHRVTRKPVARSVANGRNGTVEKDPYVERCDVSSDVETAGSGVPSCS